MRSHNNAFCTLMYTTEYSEKVLGEKSPRQKPSGHKLPDKNPLDKTPLAKNPPTKTPRQNILFRNFITFVFNPPGTKGFGTHTKHQGGGGSKRTPPVSQEREMLQT